MTLTANDNMQSEVCHTERYSESETRQKPHRKSRQSHHITLTVVMLRMTTSRERYVIQSIILSQKPDRNHTESHHITLTVVVLRLTTSRVRSVIQSIVLSQKPHRKSPHHSHCCSAKNDNIQSEVCHTEHYSESETRQKVTTSLSLL